MSDETAAAEEAEAEAEEYAAKLRDIEAEARQKIQEAIADGTVELLEMFAEGRVENCVNMETEVLGTCVISVRHLDEVGVLAKILQVLRGNGINVNQMSNRIFLGSVAAVATIAVGQAPTPEALDELRSIDEVLGISVNPLTHDG